MLEGRFIMTGSRVVTFRIEDVISTVEQESQRLRIKTANQILKSYVDWDMFAGQSRNNTHW